MGAARSKPCSVAAGWFGWRSAPRTAGHGGDADLDELETTFLALQPGEQVVEVVKDQGVEHDCHDRTSSPLGMPPS